MIRSLSHGEKAALLINEAQLGVIDPRFSRFAGLAQQAEERGIVARIAALAQVFRAKGLPVFHLPVVHRPDFADVQANTLIMALTLKSRGMTVGSEEADYVSALRPEPGDFEMIRSSGLVAFNGTSLDAMLRRLDVQTIVLTGVSTNVALPGNAMAAADHGFHVVIPEDCIAGSDAETHATLVREQLRLLATMTTADEVAAAISGA
ncbi:MAG: hypothetical protein JWQ29_2838 [Phenylobacterium sp.]|nr:hypothetical protein [Phenylobacterium sp.]